MCAAMTRELAIGQPRTLTELIVDRPTQRAGCNSCRFVSIRG